MRSSTARLRAEWGRDPVDVVHHGRGVLVAGADFSDIRAAVRDSIDGDLVSRQLDALEDGHEWTEPASYEDAVLPNTSPLVALRFASQRQALAKWTDWYRGAPHRSVSRRADDDRVIVTLLDDDGQSHRTAAEFSVEEFLQLAEFGDVEAFELRRDLIEYRRSVVFAQNATYRMEVVESSPKSRNQAAQHGRDVLHPS